MFVVKRWWLVCLVLASLARIAWSDQTSSQSPTVNYDGQLTQFVGTVTDASIQDGFLKLELSANGRRLKIRGTVDPDSIRVTPGQLVQVTGVLEPTDDEADGYFMPLIAVQAFRVKDASNRPLFALLAAVAGGSFFLFFTWLKRGADQQNFQRVVNERLAEISHVGRLDLLADMVGALAHQLNQPLTSVCSFARAAQIIKKNTPESQELDVCLEQIYEEGMRAGNIIRRIRALSRPRTDRRVKTDINQVIEDVVEIFQLQSAVPGNLLKLELDPNLERPKIDEVQIQQVLLNLLNNARDATSEATAGPPRIEITSKMIGQDIEISVTDNGTGMPMDDMARVFGRYFTTKPDGCGLGLSISKAIVESHHGRISAQRVQPQGTCVRFTLPTALVDDSSMGPPTITGVIEDRAGEIAARSTADET